MKYKNTYTDLVPNRNFYTIWAKLPKEAETFIHEYLSPIKDSLEWASTFSEELTSKTPHITLRYLGYLDEINKEKINIDVAKFKKELKDIILLNLELGKIEIYTDYLEGKLSKVRLSWEILDITKLREIHNKLLKVEGYDFFTKLEGDNFHPHISLGSINPVNIMNIEKVKQYIEINKVLNKEYIVKDIELNLCDYVIPLKSLVKYER